MLRGIRTDQELDPSLLLRDTRTMGQRFVDFIKNPTSVSILLFSSSGAVIFYPICSIYLLFVAVCLFFITFSNKAVLPFRLPQTSGKKDFNDIYSTNHFNIRNRRHC